MNLALKRTGTYAHNFPLKEMRFFGRRESNTPLSIPAMGLKHDKAKSDVELLSGMLGGAIAMDIESFVGQPLVNFWKFTHVRGPSFRPLRSSFDHNPTQTSVDWLLERKQGLTNYRIRLCSIRDIKFGIF